MILSSLMNFWDRLCNIGIFQFFGRLCDLHLYKKKWGQLCDFGIFTFLFMSNVVSSAGPMFLDQYYAKPFFL